MGGGGAHCDCEVCGAIVCCLYHQQEAMSPATQPLYNPQTSILNIDVSFVLVTTFYHQVTIRLQISDH